MSNNDYIYTCTRSPTDIINDKPRVMTNYVRYMLDRLQQMYKIDGLPGTIPERIVKMQLLRHGYVVLTDQHNGNLYSYFGGLGGEPDEYYRPTICTIANPYQRYNANVRIKDDAEGVIILNDSMLTGVLPICERYAALITEVDISLRMASINSRALNVFRAGDDNTAKAAAKFLRDLEAGELGVAIGGNGTDWRANIDSIPLTSNMSAGYIIQLLEMRQYYLAQWWQEMGVQANHTMKREAINESEAAMNEPALLPLVDDMLHCWQDGFCRVNKRYGTNITVSKSSAWAVEEQEAEDSEDGGDAENADELENVEDVE